MPAVPGAATPHGERFFALSHRIAITLLGCLLLLLWLPLATDASPLNLRHEPLLRAAQALRTERPLLFGEAQGVVVHEVLPRSPADQAGLGGVGWADDRRPNTAPHHCTDTG